jgi:ubiquinone/menaquinone biosynthesis C-methylase UbiE
MSTKQNLLMRMFGCPQGLLGRLGGMIMGFSNSGYGAEVADLLHVTPNDRVLEVGFGPGNVIRHLATLAGYVAGVDKSREMVDHATARNTAAIRSNRVRLLLGSVESLPFEDASFDKALAVNSMQVWPDAMAGLREIRRVMKPGGEIALGFTPHSGQPNEGLEANLEAAGFVSVHVVAKPAGFCVLATRA